MSCLIGTTGHSESENPTLVEALVASQSGKDHDFRELPAEIGTKPLDVVILRVAAGEGLTQSIKRRIDILNLLPFGNLVVVVTEPERVDTDSCVMIMDDIVHALDGTRFERAPIIPVSTKTGEGVAMLASALDQMVPQSRQPAHPTTLGEFKVQWLEKPVGAGEYDIEVDGRQILGKITLTDEEGIVQVRFPEPVPLAPGSPILIRKRTPHVIIGGGSVRNHQPEGQSKSDGIRRIQLTNIEEGIIAAVHEDPNGVSTQEICRLMGGVSQQQLGDYFERLIKERRIIGFAGIWYQPHVFLAQANIFLKALREIHDEHPLALFQPREAVLQRTKHNWSGKPLDRILTKLAELGKIEIDGTKVKLTDFKIALNPRQEAFLQRVEEELNKILINVPYPSEIASKLGAPVQAVEEILNTAANAGRIVKVGEALYYTNLQIERLKESIRKESKGRPFSTVEMKEAFETSRKYISAVLDYFDATGFTVRADGLRIIQD